MALDLSALDDSEFVADGATGKPLELLLADIEEDPDQPRTDFDPEYMATLANSIELRGVKSPISVRPHPTKPNKWIINNGARRFRASLMAKKKTIPAFVDEVFDDYDQVIVNDQHATLTPMERARFIAKKIAEGDKKGVIAKKLSIDSASLTHHLALLDLPASIEAVFRSGRCTSIKTLYDLRNLRDNFPLEVDRWCASADAVTRPLVSALGATLNAPAAAVEQSASASVAVATPTAAAVDGGSPASTAVAPTATKTKVSAAGALAGTDQAKQVAQMVRQLAAIENALTGNMQALAYLETATSALRALNNVLVGAE